MRCRAATSCFVISRCIPKMTKNGLKQLYTHDVEVSTPNIRVVPEKQKMRCCAATSCFHFSKVKVRKSENLQKSELLTVEKFGHFCKKRKKAKKKVKLQEKSTPSGGSAQKHQKTPKVTKNDKIWYIPKITKITKSKSARAHFSVFTFQNRIPKSTPRGPPPAKPYGGSG